METGVDNAVEEREEGEIVDDDLEDISDCSMSSGSPLYFGKSVSPPELLRAVCLSSVSSGDYSAEDRNYVPLTCSRSEENRRSLPKKRLSRCKRQYNRSRQKPVISQFESEDESVDPRYAKKLKVALDREPSEEILHNSLKTRLKAFIEPSSYSEDEGSLNTLRDLALLSTLKDDQQQNGKLTSKKDESKNDNPMDVDNHACSQLQNENIKEAEVKNMIVSSEPRDKEDSLLDSELRDLRIAALKSFVIENHKRRRRKAMGGDNRENNETSDIDKENDKSILNNDADTKTKKINCDAETDCEPLDKVLPDSIAKLESDNVESAGDCLDSEEDADILRAMLLASMSKKLAGKTVDMNHSSNLELSKNLSQIYKVEKSKTNNSLSVTIKKPFFKTIKNDLYSLTRTNSKSGQNNKKEFPTNVIVKPLIINVNNDSDSDTESWSISENSNTLKATVTEFLKKQRAEVEAQNKSPQTPELSKLDDPLIEKSVVKLLPHSQQMEYRRLKQQLINARKKMRIRRPSQRLSESKKDSTKKVSKFKTEHIKSADVSSSKMNKNIQEHNVQSPASLLKTLNQLQILKNGRLQMKGKYQSLAPLLSRINQASSERRQHELEIKRLLLQIQKARTKLATSHQDFTVLVQQLLREKINIDKRTYKATKSLNSAFATSTPNKSTTEVQNSADIEETIIKKDVASTTDTECKPSETIVPEEPKSTTDADQKLQDLVDPNDVTKVFVEQPLIDCGVVPKYISPLDNREAINNPLTTYCPYELLGVCKDKECLYMHCL